MMTINKNKILLLVTLLLIWFIHLIDFNPKNLPLLLDIRHITPVSPMYYIKIAREFMQSKFVFGDEDLSYWYFTLAKKRLDEADLLSQYQLNQLVEQQKKLAEQDNTLGYYHLTLLIDVVDTNFLEEFYASNQNRTSN